MVQLPSGERVTPWWRKGPNLRNIVDVRSADEFVAYLHEAANLDLKTGRARLVCVEYFAGWCHACRSVHPKLGKMAEKEFPDVLFLRVHKDDVPELCESLGVTKLPFVQLYKGVDGLVSQFPVSVTAPALARFRGELNQHRARQRVANRCARRGEQARRGDDAAREGMAQPLHLGAQEAQAPRVEVLQGQGWGQGRRSAAAGVPEGTPGERKRRRDVALRRAPGINSVGCVTFGCSIVYDGHRL